MFQAWSYSLISVAIVSLISLVGVFTLTFNPERLKKISLLLVSFAVGSLFGDALIHLLPETFSQIKNALLASLLVLAGVILFFVLEKFLRWRHCHQINCPEHSLPLATISLVADSVHNFIDGVLIAASFLVSLPIGLTTTLAVIFHEIPQEIGNFGVLIHAGFSTKRALLYNFLSALTAILGVVLTLVIGSRSQEFSLFLLPITAGGFLYIAGADLLPELHRENGLKTSFWQLFLMLLGIGIMILLTFLD
jgi:zinc and cadmium transporter